MSASTPDTLKQRLAHFGARGDDCVTLCRGDDVQHGYRDPRILRYVDLVRNPQMPLVDVVVEEQAQPLLYVVDAARFTGASREEDKIKALRRSLAMRGDQAWLGVLRFGRLDIYATDLQPQIGSDTFKSFSQEQADALGALPRLAQGEDLVDLPTLRLREVLLGLMRDAGAELRGLGLTVAESIALTGRALFFRYLVGREIIRPHHRGHIAPQAQSWEQCFGSAENLLSTNTWLDDTFNGDLLKLPQKDYRVYFGSLLERHGSKVTRPLKAILGLDHSVAPGASQLLLNWGDLDFNHVPIGLLSETYEALMKEFLPEKRRNTSIYYTPAPIADYMVAQALQGHTAGSRAKVLDPACGAGIFLVSAFRRLAELRFEETGQRPGRKALRDILNDQLVGFDINSHARTLAALALYLTALELDPYPAPVEALTFKKLEGRVLVDVADPGAQQQASAGPDVSMPMAGSLGEHVSQEYLGAFDLVIGNPPWTSLKSDGSKEGPALVQEIDQTFTKLCRTVAGERGLDDIAAEYQNPDKVTDLPFVWAAMQWAKPHGRIALVVAGRWLFKTSDSGFAARSAVFRALAITGVLNGASLRQGNVWPEVSQPFSLLFADNRLPVPDDKFVFVSPEYEPDLSEKGRMRIDAYDAVPVSLEMAATERSLFKTMYRGTGLDARIVERVRGDASGTIKNFWAKANGLQYGTGFTVGREKLKDDRFLAGLPRLEADYETHPFVVDVKTLNPYRPGGLYRTSRSEIYRAPLMLVRKTLREDRIRGRALVAETDIAYRETYYGFSAAGHVDGKFLTRYLLVLVHSQLFEYVSLMTSAKFGFERDTLYLEDIENFPFIPPEALTPEQRSAIEYEAQRLTKSQPNWEDLDIAVLQLYGIGPRDAQVIKDTLETRLPFAQTKERANARVTQHEREAFGVRLQKELASVLGASGYAVQVQLLPAQGELPWRFVAISVSKDGSQKQALSHVLPDHWLDKADDLAVSRITVIDASRALIMVGLLDRYRYWTLTQARLLASDILWEHGAMLEQRAG